MGVESWRGTVGMIKPTYRGGGLEEFIRLLPDGISVIPLYQGFREGTVNEFRGALASIEEKVAELTRIGVDLIHPGGAPPFMVHGFKKEGEIIAEWESRYGKPISTSGTTQVAAMRALNIRRIVGVTYFKGELNDMFARYFTDAGFDVLAMDGMDVPFQDVGGLSSHQVYAHTVRSFLKHPQADGIYMLGSGWRVLDIVATLEQDLEVPVLHPVAANVWSVQRHFHVRQKTTGFGKLLAELPKLAG